MSHNLKSKVFNPEEIKSAALSAMLADAQMTDDRDSLTISELIASDKLNRKKDFWYGFCRGMVKSGKWIKTTKKNSAGQFATSYKKK